MGNESNIIRRFSMDHERLQVYQERLANWGIDAGDMLEKINCPEALESAGKKALWIHGTAGVVLLGAQVFSSTNGSLVLSIILWIGLGISIVNVVRANQARMHSLAIRADAVQKQIALEGDDGFLWRFEPFLSDWDTAPPEPVAQSLRPICALSKQALPMPAYHELRAYWYWLNALQKNLGSLISMPPRLSKSR